MTINRRMAQALIDIHNILPDGIDDLYQAYQQAYQDEGDSELDFNEYLELEFSNLLVDLWDIQHRFATGVLEEVINPPVSIEQEKSALICQDAFLIPK